MRRGRGRRMRGEGITPGGFPGPNRGGGGDGRRRRFRGGDRPGMQRRAPVDQATRVKQIAERRGITTEQASELFKQRQEKRQERRDARKAARTERRVEQVSERRGISKEDAQKLIAERRAKRAERRAAQDRWRSGERSSTPGQDGASLSREERIASRKKEFLSRIRERMGMDEGKRADFQERMQRAPGGGSGRGRRMRGGRETGSGSSGRMFRGGSQGFYDRNSPNYWGNKGQIRREREQRAPGNGRGARRGMRRRMRGGQEQVGTMVGS